MQQTLVCRDCASRETVRHPVRYCKACNSEWLKYAFEEDVICSFEFGHSVNTLWNFFDLLPIASRKNVVSFGEGGTPVTHLQQLGKCIGLKRLYIKDERGGNTGSFKDRGASVAVSSLKERGVRDFVYSSVGNMGAAYAAYCARALIRAHAFVPASAPRQKVQEMELYGAKVFRLNKTYDECKAVAKEYAQERGFECEMGTRDPLRVEAKKTIAFEVHQQLPRVDRFFQAASGGTGFLGYHKGAQELQMNGFIRKPARVHAVQAAGCCPMYSAYARGNMETYTPVHKPKTHITTLATGNPIGYRHVAQVINETGGSFERVTDQQAFRAVKQLAKTEGILVDAATGVALAAVISMAKSGAISPLEYVVLNGGSHGLREFDFLTHHIK